jgi:N-hydroxyarylamine O-acetyltransferase
LLSARVANEEGVASQEFDHLTLRVDLEESWLADVGFGDNFLEPLRLAGGIEQQDAAGSFRLVDADSRWRLERLQPDGLWRLQYDFSLQPRHLDEFAGMCHYHQTSPDSHFTRNRICSLATPDGRITLSGMRLIITSHDGREERTLGTEADWRSALHDRFGFVLD